MGMQQLSIYCLTTGTTTRKHIGLSSEKCLCAFFAISCGILCICFRCIWCLSSARGVSFLVQRVTIATRFRRFFPRIFTRYFFFSIFFCLSHCRYASSSLARRGTQCSAASQQLQCSYNAATPPRSHAALTTGETARQLILTRLDSTVKTSPLRVKISEACRLYSSLSCSYRSATT